MEKTYKKTTQGITVSVTPIFLEDQSEPMDENYTWAYFVRLENEGDKTVQLISRHWKITDANGITQEVKGPGVVGEKPSLKPGESYEYSSGTVLNTPSGIMLGTYQMIAEQGDMFDAVIPAFSLDSPMQPKVLH